MSNTDLQFGLEAFENQRYSEAHSLLRPLAEQGNPEAQCVIGNVYQLGLGVEPDLAAAAEWYRKSAEQGYGVASNNLAGMMQTGYEGVPPNPTEASRLYEQAQQQGFDHSPSSDR